MRFEIKVPDHGGDGESLGFCNADVLPRVGDAFLLYHPKVCGQKREPFEGKVDAIVWEAFYEDGLCKADPTVWLIGGMSPVQVYCVCSEKEREGSREGHEADLDYIDKEGICFNCGDERPPNVERPF